MPRRIVVVRQPRQRPPRRWLPYRWKLPVHEVMVRRTLWPFLLLAGVLGVGSFAWAAKGWERATQLLAGLGVLQQLRAVPTLLLWASILSAIAFVLMILILSGILDAVIVLSVARNLIFVAALYVIYVLFRQLDPASLLLGSVLMGLTALAVVIFQVRGPLGEHWIWRAYGDVLLEAVIFVPFLVLLWVPMTSTGQVRALIEELFQWGARVIGYA